MNHTSTSGILQVAFDIVVALIFFLVACVFAEVMYDLTGTEQLWPYAALFAIGMLPILLYARHRGVAEFDRWDVLAYSTVPVHIAAALSWANDPLMIGLATVASAYLAARLRRIFPHQGSAAT